MPRTLLKYLTIHLLFFTLTACGGRAANPVMVTQYGDQNKSCEALQADISYIQSEIYRLVPETEKTGSNVALGVAGAFLLVPWFFMDFSEAEQIEVNALRQRYNYLVILSNEKNCGFNLERIPDKQPTQEAENESDGNAQNETL